MKISYFHLINSIIFTVFFAVSLNVFYHYDLTPIGIFLGAPLWMVLSYYLKSNGASNEFILNVLPWVSIILQVLLILFIIFIVKIKIKFLRFGAFKGVLLSLCFITTLLIQYSIIKTSLVGGTVVVLLASPVLFCLSPLIRLWIHCYYYFLEPNSIYLNNELLTDVWFSFYAFCGSIQLFLCIFIIKYHIKSKKSKVMS